MHKFILSLVLALALVPARTHSADNAEIAELRRQVEALTKTVTQLQQQVNQQRLAPMFGDGTPPGGGKSVVTRATDHDHRHAKHESSSFTPNISLTLDAVGSYSRRADNVNLIARDVQLTVSGEVDDFARAYAVVNAGTELAPTEKTDPFEEISLSLEEGAIETTSLPYGLQLKAGQFFADFTRLGKLHGHDLPFTDRPLSLELIVGGETKARGLEVSWIPPIDPKLRFTAGIVDNVGAEPPVTRRLSFLEEGDEEFGSAFAEADRRGFDNLTFYARAARTFDLNWQTQLHVGANYLHGREEGVRTMASTDARLVWTPRSGSDLFELGGEYLWSRTEGRFADDLLPVNEETGALLPVSSTAHARGGYAYAQYRFGKSLQPGVRFDFVHPEAFEEADLDADGERDTVLRTRDDIFTYSAYVNWHFSELNRLRLQLNYIKGEREVTPGSDDDWQAFLQWTVILGPHEHATE